MVDIHTHILPEMDDGASSLEESLEMCAAAAESGVKTIVATPHFYDVTVADAFLEKREARLALLKSGLMERGLSWRFGWAPRWPCGGAVYPPGPVKKAFFRRNTVSAGGNALFSHPYGGCI